MFKLISVKMRHYLFIISLIIGLAINQGFAQQKPTSDALVINTPINFTEENVDRTVTFDAINNSSSAILIENADASYTGTEVNIFIDQIDNSSALYGINLNNNGKSINLNTSGEGIWNTVTVSGMSTANGIGLMNTSEVSRISNTKIDVTGELVYGIYSELGKGVELDNVNIHISSFDSSSLSGYGMVAHGSRITNEGKGQVTIISDFTAMSSAIYSQDGTVDFHDATISVLQTGTPGGSPFGVLTMMSTVSESSVSLKKSSIASTDGNILAFMISTNVANASIANLDGVNLDKAKNQAIIHMGEARLNLSNGTNLDGYVQEYVVGLGDLDLNITSGASWNVTANSALGTGTLSLDGTSTISFEELSEGSFANIASASIALEAGAILMLGATAEEIQALLDGNEGRYDVKLFDTSQEFSNEGVILVTSDGRKLEYTPDNWGTYTLTSILPASIPEPTTSTLWLAAFGLLALRRMKN